MPEGCAWPQGSLQVKGPWRRRDKAREMSDPEWQLPPWEALVSHSSVAVLAKCQANFEQCSKVTRSEGQEDNSLGMGLEPGQPGKRQARTGERSSPAYAPETLNGGLHQELQHSGRKSQWHFGASVARKEQGHNCQALQCPGGNSELSTSPASWWRDGCNYSDRLTPADSRVRSAVGPGSRTPPNSSQLEQG